MQGNRLGRGRRGFAGRLVADDEGVHPDDTGEMVAYAFPDSGGFSAEELAVRIRSDEELEDAHDDEDGEDGGTTAGGDVDDETDEGSERDGD